MSPFAGVGVNLALFDAVELAKAVIAHCKPGHAPDDISTQLAAAVREYESSMFERAEENARRTWRNLEVFFSPGGIGKIMKMFQGKPPDPATDEGTSAEPRPDDVRAAARGGEGA